MATVPEHISFFPYIFTYSWDIHCAAMSLTPAEEWEECLPTPGKERRGYRTWCELLQAFANTNCQNPFYGSKVCFKSVKLQGHLRKRSKTITKKKPRKPEQRNPNQTTVYKKKIKSSKKNQTK